VNHKRSDELTHWLLHSLVRYDRNGNIHKVARRIPFWLRGVMTLMQSRGLCVFVGGGVFELTRKGFEIALGPDTSHTPKDSMFAAGDRATAVVKP